VKSKSLYYFTFSPSPQRSQPPVSSRPQPSSVHPKAPESSTEGQSLAQNLAQNLQIKSPTVASELLWDKSGYGTVQNPFKSVQERKEKAGNAGRKIKLLTNHFDMKIKQSIVHVYSIVLKFPWSNIRKKDKPLHYRCVEQIKLAHCEKVSFRKL